MLLEIELNEDTANRNLLQVMIDSAGRTDRILLVDWQQIRSEYCLSYVNPMSSMSALNFVFYWQSQVLAIYWQQIDNRNRAESAEHNLTR